MPHYARNIPYIVAAVVIIGIMAALYWFLTAKAEVGNLDIIAGSVEVSRGGSSEPANTGEGINLNDIVQVAPSSRASIILKDGSVIRLEAGTAVAIAELEYEGQKIKKAVFQLKFGRLWSSLQPLALSADFAVETPTVVAVVRGTKFNVDYLNQASAIFAFENFISVNLKNNLGASVRVVPHQLFKIRDQLAAEDFAVGPLPAPADYLDDWLLFNIEEEGVVSAPTAANITTANSIKKESEPVPKPQFNKTIEEKKESPAKKIISLILKTEKTTAVVGEPIHLQVVAQYSDGTVFDLTKNSIFDQQPGLGQIDNLGNFRGFASGKTVLTANFDNIKSNSVELTILPPEQPPQQGQSSKQQQ